MLGYTMTTSKLKACSNVSKTSWSRAHRGSRIFSRYTRCGKRLRWVQSRCYRTGARIAYGKPREFIHNKSLHNPHRSRIRSEKKSCHDVQGSEPGLEKKQG